MVAVVLGGGVGTRFGAALPKQLLTLAGKTLVEHCVGAFTEAPGIDETVLVMPSDYHQEARRIVGDQVSVIEGGATRSDSVRNALAYLVARYPEAETGVLLHDAADRDPPDNRRCNCRLRCWDSSEQESTAALPSQWARCSSPE